MSNKLFMIGNWIKSKRFYFNFIRQFTKFISKVKIASYVRNSFTNYDTIMTTSTVQALMTQICAPSLFAEKLNDDKVSIIGAGSIGAACLFALISERVSNDIVLIDKDLSMAKDELDDIQNASVYMGNPNLTYSTDYEETRSSRVIVLTAGQYLSPMVELDLSIMEKNVSIFEEIIPQILAYSPQCTLVVVTRPVDIMSYVAWKISGLPPNRIIGTGCSLLSARFRDCIAQKLNVSTKLVQAYVIGENGTKCVPVWSSVSACGIRLRDINPELGTTDDPEDWHQMFQDILQSSYNIVKTKMFNTWGVAASVAHISYSIIWNTRECITVSTHIKGCQDGDEKNNDVFMSLPCIIGAHGVNYIVRQILSDKDKEQLQNSADKLLEIQSKLKI